MLTVTLPDGSRKQFDRPVSAYDVAAEIGPGLAKAALAGDFTTARTAHERYYTLFKELFVEPNPVPIKFALASKGLMTADVRLPLCPMSVPNQHRLTALLKALGFAS